MLILFFFFNDTATTEIYTLSLHDALPIYCYMQRCLVIQCLEQSRGLIIVPFLFHLKLSGNSMAGKRGFSLQHLVPRGDRKSTRLNSSHANISYAVFCLKKKKKSNSQVFTI